MFPLLGFKLLKEKRELRYSLKEVIHFHVVTVFTFWWATSRWLPCTVAFCPVCTVRRPCLEGHGICALSLTDRIRESSRQVINCTMAWLLLAPFPASSSPLVNFLGTISLRDYLM